MLPLIAIDSAASSETLPPPAALSALAPESMALASIAAPAATPTRLALGAAPASGPPMKISPPPPGPVAANLALSLRLIASPEIRIAPA